VVMDCAVLKIPLKSPGPGPSLTLRQIDAPGTFLSFLFLFTVVSIIV